MAKKKKKTNDHSTNQIIMKYVNVDEVYACLPGIETNMNESALFKKKIF